VARRSWTSRLLLVLGGLAAGLLLLEGILRVLHAGARPLGEFDTSSAVRNSRFIAHPFLPFIGRPSQRFELFNGPEQTPEFIEFNSYGFRSHEFPTEKKPNDYFVLAFGGSTTYGYKVESNDATWPELLEKRLAAEYPDKHVRVFNMGVDMAGGAFAVVNLGLIGVHLQPDLVIFYEGYNDLAALGYANFRSDYAHFYRDIDPDSVSRGFQLSLPPWLGRSYVAYYLTGALDRYYGMNDLMMTARMPQVHDGDRFKGIRTALENYKTIDAMARGYGAKTLFATFQFTHESTQPEYQRYNQELRRWFDGNGYAYVDQAALIPDEDSTINVDDCHFTRKGNEMMAENFYRAIVEKGLVK
jgi:lysophospholipase L1-like esterase